MTAPATHHCPTCHASSSKYWFRITPGLTGALIKFKRAVIAKGENSVHTRKDMDGTPYELTKTEYANFTVLRFHGLVAKDKEAGRGHWLLTSRGNAYLQGRLTVPQKVCTLNNHVVDHSELHVDVVEVMGSRPYFEDDHEREAQPLELAQGALPL